MKLLIAVLLLAVVAGCSTLSKEEKQSIKGCLEKCREDFYRHKEGKTDSDDVYAARDSAIRANIKILKNSLGED